ncbi:MAG: hypothetical protein BM564_02155 [Bacteroidetes bacterium MedPE-SWsnd-G2]|nr:MAG: hypothetical protein BM564_02155 [Bacteroidetes bacterium MedPE-SWsnd-G2]
MEKKPKKKNQLNKFAQLIGVALQMGITIYLGVYLGKWLDQEFSSGKVFTIICTLLALGASLWSVISQLNKINDKYD